MEIADISLEGKDKDSEDGRMTLIKEPAAEAGGLAVHAVGPATKPPSETEIGHVTGLMRA